MTTHPERRTDGAPVKVAHLTSVHPVTDQRILAKECETLAAEGYEVFVIGLGPRPENDTSVHLIHTERPPTRFRRWTRTVPWVFGQARLVGADVYHIHDPELLPVGLLLKALGHRVVYDVHEDYPAAIGRKTWIPRPLRRTAAAVFGAAEIRASKRLDAVVTVTDHIQARFPGQTGAVVRNFPRLDFFLENPLPDFGRPPIVLYLGGITQERGAFQMVKAMTEVDRTRGARLVLAGPMNPPSLLASLEHTEGWDRTEYRGIIPYASIAATMAQAHVGLALLHPSPNNLTGRPGKIYEYMAAGLPVVVSRPIESAAIVEQAQCGLLVDPLDTHAIATAISWLLDHPKEAAEMGARGREEVRRKYSWATEGRTLLKLYAHLTAQTQIPHRAGKASVHDPKVAERR